MLVLTDTGVAGAGELEYPVLSCQVASQCSPGVTHFWRLYTPRHPEVGDDALVHSGLTEPLHGQQYAFQPGRFM